MDSDASFHDAKRLYLEQYGDPMVTNTYLKIALALLSIVCVALALIDLRTIRTFQNFRPLVIRIDDLGRAEAINYHNLEYKPQDAEAKYFLSEFCALYYRRNRYTIQDDFSKSLYFLDGKLADGIFDAYRKDDIIKKFITNTAAPEIDVDVKKVALEEMQTPPFRARVDFYMVYYSPADHSELKRDLYTANFVFVFKSQVPNELIPDQSARNDHHLLPRRPGVQMRIRVHTQTEEVAGGRRATSAQPRRATSVLTPRALLLHTATSQLTGFCLWNNRRASGGPPFRPAFRPLPEPTRFVGKTLTEAEEFTMIANALLFTIVILLGYGFWLLDQLKFMARYKAVLYHAYGTTILIFLAVLFVNLFGAALAIGRRFFLKNTGRKLSHLDKQFNVSHADMPVPVSEEDFN